MKTKTMKILVTLATIVLILSIGGSMVYANSTSTLFSPGEINPTLEKEAENEIKAIGGKIIGLIQGVGIVLTVVILSILGIKYMMGSAEEKAEYKKTMIPYVVGAVCIFASTSIATLVYKIAQF